MSYPRDRPSGDRPNLPPIESLLGYSPPRVEAQQSNRESLSHGTRQSRPPEEGRGWSPSSSRIESRASYPSLNRHPSLQPASSSVSLPSMLRGRSTGGSDEDDFGTGQPSRFAFDNFQPSSRGPERIPSRADSRRIDPDIVNPPQRLVRWVPPVSSPDRGNPVARPYPYQQDQQGYPDDSKRYECTYCQRRFSRPSSLQTHMHTHTGETPYRCTHPGCGKSFNVSSNMRRHMRKHEDQSTDHSFRKTESSDGES